ncbi:MAG: hypothetical protein GY862_10820 [Gammaproteobacteria bacterium]|nr:hypothetical protein [Gammaproteobacteria bacterium]
MMTITARPPGVFDIKRHYHNACNLFQQACQARQQQKYSEYENYLQDVFINISIAFAMTIQVYFESIAEMPKSDLEKTKSSSIGVLMNLGMEFK